MEPTLNFRTALRRTGLYSGDNSKFQQLREELYSHCIYFTKHTGEALPSFVGFLCCLCSDERFQVIWYSVKEISGVIIITVRVPLRVVIVCQLSHLQFNYYHNGDDLSE